MINSDVSNECTLFQSLGLPHVNSAMPAIPVDTDIRYEVIDRHRFLGTKVLQDLCTSNIAARIITIPLETMIFGGQSNTETDSTYHLDL